MSQILALSFEKKSLILKYPFFLTGDKKMKEGENRYLGYIHSSFPLHSPPLARAGSYNLTI